MQRTSEFLEVEAVAPNKSFDDLAAMRDTIAQMRLDLLDYNPLLAIIAESLQNAVELELETYRYDIRIESDRG